jgi:4-aminobutyrate--pyruvate transaminase
MLQERGVISRNMLDAIAICPPLIVTKAQIDELIAAITGVLNDMKPEVAKLPPA